jgi:hypothetical protein
LIPPKGELAQLLDAYPLGTVVAPDNIEQIKAGILRASQMAASATDQIPPDSSLINQFDRRLQTGQLADVLNALTAQR